MHGFDGLDIGDRVRVKLISSWTWSGASSISYGKLMAKAAPESPFTPAGFFSYRTPLLPFEELEAFGEGLEAPAAAATPNGCPSGWKTPSPPTASGCAPACGLSPTAPRSWRPCFWPRRRSTRA